MRFEGAKGVSTERVKSRKYLLLIKTIHDWEEKKPIHSIITGHGIKGLKIFCVS